MVVSAKYLTALALFRFYFGYDWPSASLVALGLSQVDPTSSPGGTYPYSPKPSAPTSDWCLPIPTLLTVSLQVSEFAFVLASHGRQMGMISREGYFLLLGTTALSFLSTPILWKISKRLLPVQIEASSIPHVPNTD